MLRREVTLRWAVVPFLTRSRARGVYKTPHASERPRRAIVSCAIDAVVAELTLVLIGVNIGGYRHNVAGATFAARICRIVAEGVVS